MGFDLPKDLVEAAKSMLAEGRAKHELSESTMQTLPNGDKYWSLNGKLHREDGPAVELANGEKRWYLNDKKLTQSQHAAATKSKLTKESVDSLDELSRKTLGSYIKKAVTPTGSGKSLGGMAASIARSFKDNDKTPEGREERKNNQRKVNNRIMGVNKATDRLTKEEVDYFIVDNYSDMIEEGAGNLKDLPSHIVKTIASKGGGEHSEVEHLGRATSASSLASLIHKGMSSGKVTVIHHNGKPIASTHVSDDYGRPKYGVQDDKGDLKAKRSEVRHGTGKWDSRLKKYIPSEVRHYEEKHHSKEEAIFKLHGIIHQHTGDDDPVSKDTYKKHNIEVKTVSRDAHRAEVHKARTDNKPAMQANYVKKPEGQKKNYWDSDSKQTSLTPKGDMSKIKDKALNKMADRHVIDNSSPKSKAEEIHKNLGHAIASGDSKAAQKHAYELDQHMRSSGLSNESPSRYEYKGIVKDIRSGHHSDYHKSRLKDMKERGKIKEETEFEYFIVDDEFGLGEILDINEDTAQVVFEGQIVEFDVDSILVEDVEQIDELSKDTITSYMSKAKDGIASTVKKGKPSKATVALRTKRTDGLENAKKKLTAILSKENAEREATMVKNDAALDSQFHKEHPAVLAKHGYNLHHSDEHSSTYTKKHDNGHVSMVHINHNARTIYGGSKHDIRTSNTKGEAYSLQRAHAGAYSAKKYEALKSEMMPRFENHVINIKNDTDREGL